MAEIYSRKQLAEAISDTLAAIEPDLEATYKVVDNPNDLGELDAAFDCYVQLVRQEVEPAPRNPRGQYVETFEVWVISAYTGDDSEDRLDDRLEEMLAVLKGIGIFTFKSAKRRTHRTERQAWMIAGEVTTE